MELKEVLNSFPKIEDGFILPQLPYSLILAAGFEDRTMNILERTSALLPSFVLLILYKGEGHPNKEKKIKTFLKKNNISFEIIEFDRKSPQDFEDNLSTKKNDLEDFPEIVVDISSMSKLLILDLLVNLCKMDQSLTITYTEPREYLPTRQQYTVKKKKIQQDSSKLYFQTLDVSATVTTRSLSSIAMADASRFLVAFPTFNEDLLITLFQEFSPNSWLLVHGLPLRLKDKWRLNAIKYINHHVLSQISDVEQTTVSTFDYLETFALLEDCYQKVKLTHKFIVGSPISKLQAVAVALFKLYRQDVQILYPTPKSYLFMEHSKFSGKIHSIRFKNFSQFVNELVKNRQRIDVGVNFNIRDTVKKENFPLAQN